MAMGTQDEAHGSRARWARAGGKNRRRDSSVIRPVHPEDVPFLRQMIYEAAYASGPGPSFEDGLVDPPALASPRDGVAPETLASSPSRAGVH